MNTLIREVIIMTCKKKERKYKGHTKDVFLGHLKF